MYIYIYLYIYICIYVYILDVSDALRQMHPFPILERFISKDITINDNNDYGAVNNNKNMNKCPFNGNKNKENDEKIAVCKDTQVVMFPSDWRENKSWPIFGAGKRVCSGAHFALPWLTLFRESMLQIINHEKKNEKNNDIKNKNKFVSRFQPELNHRYVFISIFYNTGFFMSFYSCLSTIRSDFFIFVNAYGE
jgi:hypothetical protein